MVRTLRMALEAEGSLPVDLGLQIGWQVVQAARELHARGVAFLLHPSNVVLNADQSVQIDVALPMTVTADAACISPENAQGIPTNDPRASVFATGALLYEMFAGSPMAPGGPAIRAIRPDLPPSLEPLLGAALARDVHARPADLNALAGALEGILNTLEPAPEEDLVPISVSTSIPAASHTPSAADELSMLKARLDADPVARFVVVKDYMDHGPFRGIELLQQITAWRFVATDELRDDTTGRRAPLGQWPEFAPFVHIANAEKNARVEREQVAVLDRTEAKSNKRTLLVGGIGLGVLVLGLVIWQVKSRDAGQKKAELASDNAVDIEVSGGLKGKPKPAGGSGGGAGGGPSGLSYEAALNVAEDMSATAGARELSNAELEAPMRNGSFVLACGAPHGSTVDVRVAVRNGRAMGVTASVNPPNPAVASCVERGVRAFAWPASAKRFTMRTSYSP